MKEYLVTAAFSILASSAALAQPQRLDVRSPAISSGQMLDRKYTALGQNLSPPISWSGAPERTQEFVLTVDDPDAAPFNRGKAYTHWVVYEIGAMTRQLPEGLPRKAQLVQPVQLKQGKNSAGKVGYTGPQPPPGSGTHHYRFRLYALDAPTNLKPGAAQQEVLDAIQGHVIAQGELVGIYEVKK